MRHPMEHLNCLHHRGAPRATAADSKQPARVWLRRMREARSPDVSSADLVPVRKGGITAYDAVDLRLMDTFPASDAVARY
jgi:hypothetical protein